MSLADILEELEATKDPHKAGPMEAYMRYQFSFLGIAGPERNALYKKYFPSAKKTRKEWLNSVSRKQASTFSIIEKRIHYLKINRSLCYNILHLKKVVDFLILKGF